MQRLTSILLFVFLAYNSHASILSGKITDEKGVALSFATVYIKGTTQGTTANIEGKYTLNLTPGTYYIVYQFIGYQKKEEQVVMGNSPVTLDVSLIPHDISLKAVTIKADAEDPAYRMIRAAIKRRKSYLEQVNAYSCKVYIKGVQILDSIPKRIMGIKTSKVGLDSSQLGIVYLSESESKYNFKQPDHVREIMVSSKVSGNNQAFSYNQASDFDFNFYKNLIEVSDLSDRGFVSPISEGALLYYKYRFIGTFYEDGEAVNKIEIIPKRKHDPVFKGYIYLVENSWRIHSVDVFLTKDANIDFVDSLRITQTFNKAEDTIWMPFNQTMVFTFKAFGINGHGRFIGIFNDYNVHPKFTKGFFKGEVLKVNDDANKKDSSYWNVNRPVPLTKEEINDYHKKDSLSHLHSSKRYLDSTDRKRNKFDVSDIITGYSYYRKYTKTSYGISGLLGFINYNTVQGWAPRLSFRYYKTSEDKRILSAAATFGYGFSNNIVSSVANIYYLSNPVRFSSWSFSGGRDISQVNSDNPISPFLNTAYTLLAKENYIKLYDHTFVKARYVREISNGIVFSGSTIYSYNAPLENTTLNTWSKKTDNSFTPNYPYYSSLCTNFTAYTSWVVQAGFTFHIKQKYYTRPNEKVIIGSKYPAITIEYKKGIEGLGSSVNFDRVDAQISDNLKFGLFGHCEYNLNAGKFLSSKYVGIAELKHFDGNQTIFATSNYMNSYQLLPYYQYSTKAYYAQAHFEYHFEGFILNKIPLIRKLKWHEVVGVHYLYTPDINYTELAIGLDDIFKVLRVDFISAYSNQYKLRSGIVLGLKIL